MKKRESVSNSLFSLFYWIFFTPTIDIEPKKRPCTFGCKVIFCLSESMEYVINPHTNRQCNNKNRNEYGFGQIGVQNIR